MTKKLAPLPLRQANLRRWLDKRVPIYVGDVELNKKDTKTLIKMINKQQIPFDLVGASSDNISIIVDEGRGCFDDFYVLYVGTLKKCKKFINKHLDN